MMSEPDLAVNVRLLAVHADGDEIAADIYGGDRGLVGTVVYRPDGGDLYRDVLLTLLFWKERGTPLTYVCRNGVASLRDEAAVFEASLGGDSLAG